MTIYFTTGFISAFSMWSIFLVIKNKHSETPISSYIPISEITAGSGTGVFRYIILRAVPVILITVGEISFLQKKEADLLPLSITTVASIIIYTIPSYILPIRKSFSFGERFIKLGTAISSMKHFEIIPTIEVETRNLFTK